VTSCGCSVFSGVVVGVVENGAGSAWDAVQPATVASPGRANSRRDWLPVTETDGRRWFRRSHIEQIAAARSPARRYAD
jgi:hypothetical protein